MAKNESSILEGLNFGAPASAPKTAQETVKVEKAPVKVVEKVAEKEKRAEKKPGRKPKAAPRRSVPSIQSTYAATFKEKQRETRSIRTTISLTPRVYDRMVQATEEGEIKSANDLINYLLEQYFAE